jgi:hypothetical protein
VKIVKTEEHISLLVIKSKGGDAPRLPSGFTDQFEKKGQRY